MEVLKKKRVVSRASSQRPDLSPSLLFEVTTDVRSPPSGQLSAWSHALPLFGATEAPEPHWRRGLPASMSLLSAWQRKSLLTPSTRRSGLLCRVTAGTLHQVGGVAGLVGESPRSETRPVLRRASQGRTDHLTLLQAKARADSYRSENGSATNWRSAEARFRGWTRHQTYSLRPPLNSYTACTPRWGQLRPSSS